MASTKVQAGNVSKTQSQGASKSQNRNAAATKAIQGFIKGNPASLQKLLSSEELPDPKDLTETEHLNTQKLLVDLWKVMQDRSSDWLERWQNWIAENPQILGSEEDGEATSLQSYVKDDGNRSHRLDLCIRILKLQPTRRSTMLQQVPLDLLWQCAEADQANDRFEEILKTLLSDPQIDPKNIKLGNAARWVSTWCTLSKMGEQMPTDRANRWRQHIAYVAVHNFIKGHHALLRKLLLREELPDPESLSVMKSLNTQSFLVELWKLLPDNSPSWLDRWQNWIAGNRYILGTEGEEQGALVAYVEDESNGERRIDLWLRILKQQPDKVADLSRQVCLDIVLEQSTASDKSRLLEILPDLDPTDIKIIRPRTLLELWKLLLPSDPSAHVELWRNRIVADKRIIRGSDLKTYFDSGESDCVDLVLLILEQQPELALPLLRQVSVELLFECAKMHQAKGLEPSILDRLCDRLYLSLMESSLSLDYEKDRFSWKQEVLERLYEASGYPSNRQSTLRRLMLFLYAEAHSKAIESSSIRGHGETGGADVFLDWLEIDFRPKLERDDQIALYRLVFSYREDWSDWLHARDSQIQKLRQHKEDI